jgi:hypothetical protein
MWRLGQCLFSFSSDIDRVTADGGLVFFYLLTWMAACVLPFRLDWRESSGPISAEVHVLFSTLVFYYTARAGAQHRSSLGLLGFCQASIRASAFYHLLRTSLKFGFTTSLYYDLSKFESTTSLHHDPSKTGVTTSLYYDPSKPYSRLTHETFTLHRSPRPPPTLLKQRHRWL